MDSTLKYKFFIDLIYVSSVTEGIHLTRLQVKHIVEDGARSSILLHNPHRNLLQAYGQKKVLDCIEKWARMKITIDTNMLMRIHKLFLAEVEPDAGTFRRGHVTLRSSALLPSFPFAISADMDDFNEHLLQLQRDIDPNNLDQVIHLVAYAFHRITMIHPFSDGNGRSARLFVNLLLRRYHLPYIIIPKVDNFKEMRNVLRAADVGDLKPLEKYMRRFLNASLRKVAKYANQ